MAPDRVVFEAMRVKPKLQWRPQEGRDARNMSIYQGKLQAVNITSSRGVPCGLYPKRPFRRASQALMSSSVHHVTWMPDMEVGDLMLAGLGLSCFVLILVCYSPVPSFWNGSFILFHGMSEVFNLLI